MKTVGTYLKDARLKKKYSRGKVAEKTKIKESFIKSIEENNWDQLPEETVVAGFVKSIASSLDLNTTSTMALFRRDYTRKAISLPQKKMLFTRFAWSPRLTFVIATVLVTFLIAGYLIFQYLQFTRPPDLLVEKPTEGQLVDGNSVQVIGLTDRDASILVNNQPVVIGDNGEFQTEVEVSEISREIRIVSRSRSGKETVVVRNIEVKGS